MDFDCVSCRVWGLGVGCRLSASVFKALGLLGVNGFGHGLICETEFEVRFFRLRYSIGAYITTNAIPRVPYYTCSIMGPKTLF